ncbi:PhoPQ-activated pathogenicity-related family protein [Chitinophaga defluvii]|uniref:PhoPQ-activated protein PqaA family protein n=1 Tax=Chitinophaga defluvii TaxID=3163343 RepID=A0ABV2SYS0_9BACT
MKPLLLKLAIIFLVQFNFACKTQAQDNVTPATALTHYLENGDNTFRWELKDSFDIGTVKAYNLLLTSQKWREHVWTHQLTVLVPEENKHDGALLFITGGSIKNGLPNWKGNDDQFIQSISLLATKNKAIVSVLRQTPNQPLYNDLTEDALISFTLHNFKKDGDYTWPLLFPMVKSAVRAMDAVQQFAKQQLHHTVNGFVVTGASKRGWTTWLTGANDERVVAIAPMVIDILNMPVNLDYQMKVWKGYSVQIEDYVNLGIPQAVHTPDGNAITAMVDPYAYRNKLTMPKLIIMGTNDEYWTVDAIKHYYDSIPGQNLIHYVPNAGHNLGDGKQAMRALSAFFGMTLEKTPYPVCTWDIITKEKKATLVVKATPKTLVDAVIWYADSPDMVFTDKEWKGESLGMKKTAEVKETISFPEAGFRAFYLDLKYKDPNGGEYTESTRMFVADKDQLFLN